MDYAGNIFVVCTQSMVLNAQCGRLGLWIGLKQLGFRILQIKQTIRVVVSARLFSTPWHCNLRKKEATGGQWEWIYGWTGKKACRPLSE